MADKAVHKEGYLLKRGELNKAWKARWCKIEKTRLLYFKKQETNKPTGFIPLEQAVIRVRLIITKFIWVGTSLMYFVKKEMQRRYG